MSASNFQLKMPPKHLQPSPVARTASTAVVKGTPNLSQADKDAKAMPPPPTPKRILEEEMCALSDCFKSAVVKTGQIYGFYADTRRLDIQRYVRQPPQSLAAALGHEVEKYDQLCDVMESHVLRAIAILERDLKREQRRVMQEEEKAAIASEMQKDESNTLSPSLTHAGLPVPPETPEIPPTSSISSPTSSIPGRRPSAISISSLHRPSFPLKLDLSAPSLRMTSDEASSLTNGLHSPVTLAPKSARPPDYPAELMAALNAAPAKASGPRVDIDLTLTERGSEPGDDIIMESSLGSADKPIELDLESIDMDMDMTDLFGDNPEQQSEEGDGAAAMDNLFSPPISHTDLADPNDTSSNNNDLKTEDQLVPPNFLESLGESSGNQGVFVDTLKPTEGDSQVAASNPSPGAIIASLTSGDNSTNTGNIVGTSGEGQFNVGGLDYSFFGGEEGGMNLDQFLAMNNGTTSHPNPSSKADTT